MKNSTAQMLRAPLAVMMAATAVTGTFALNQFYANGGGSSTKLPRLWLEQPAWMKTAVTIIVCTSGLVLAGLVIISACLFGISIPLAIRRKYRQVRAWWERRKEWRRILKKLPDPEKPPLTGRYGWIRFLKLVWRPIGTWFYNNRRWDPNPQPIKLKDGHGLQARDPVIAWIEVTEQDFMGFLAMSGENQEPPASMREVLGRAAMPRDLTGEFDVGKLRRELAGVSEG